MLRTSTAATGLQRSLSLKACTLAALSASSHTGRWFASCSCSPTYTLQKQIQTALKLDSPWHSLVCCMFMTSMQQLISIFASQLQRSAAEWSQGSRVAAHETGILIPGHHVTAS